jgi:hypothetical protein
VTVKVKVGQTQNIRLVAAGEKRPVIVPDSITLGIDTVGPYISGVVSGNGIVITTNAGTGGESANVVISHAGTSSSANTNNSTLEFIQNATIDSFGHITGFSNAGLNANNFSVSSSLITAKNITFGNTAITLGQSTDEIRELNLAEIGEFTITANTISVPGNLNFNLALSDAVINAGTHRITNVEDPINAQDVVNKRFLEVQIDSIEQTVKVIQDPVLETDATNKRYVDALVQGLVVRPAALAATTADLGGTFDSGNTTFASTITLDPVNVLYIDDVTRWEVGSNLLVKDQNDPVENGSYDLIQKGNANTAWIFQRTEWSNESSEVPGSFEFVTDGTVNAGTGWVATVADASTFVINTDDVIWSQFSGEGTYTAGRGLTLTGRQFVVDKIQDIEQISGNGAIIIPVGESVDRPTPATGMIRFNSQDGQFEGYDGIAWAGLGGVIDVNQDTKITAEDSPGLNNDQLKFYAGGTLAAIFGANTASFTGDVAIAGNLTIGDQPTDTVNFAADVTSDIIPAADRTYSLGDESNNWNKINVDTLSSSDGIVKFDGTGAIKLPSANTALRPTGQAGMLRFNSEEGRFEGYDGNIWTGIAGSVIDLDKNTYIIAETSAGANNNELDFWTDNVQRMQIGAAGDLLFGSNLDKLIINYNTGDMFVNGKLTATNNLIIDPVGYISVANNTITDLADPVNPGDAVNLNYLDNQFASDLTIIDGANTYATDINLLASPKIEIGRGLELEEISSANNSFKIGLDVTGATPGLYGQDGFSPRLRVTEDGRIDFVTDIPIELQANAIPNFTETSRDIIALMFTDGNANNEGITAVNDDINDVMNLIVNNFNITLDGDVSGTAQVTRLSDTTITTSLTADFISNLAPTSANSGIIVTHTPGPNSNASIEVDYTALDARYQITGGDFIASRYLDADNTNFYMDPAGTSRVNQIDVGYGSTFSQLRMRDGPGSFSVLYGSGGKIGFLDNTFNYAAYSERSTGDWVVQNGDVKAERFVDANATTYFLHPGGTDSNLKQINVEDKITVSDIAIGGDVGARTIKTTTGILTVDASGGISLQGAGNDLNVNNSKITNLLNPTSGQDAATKSYVDAVAQGLRVIPSALAATTENLDATFLAGVLTSANTEAFSVDDVTDWSVGDRVLVKDQTNPLENGSYEVTVVGDVSTQWVLTRGEYFNESSEIPGAFQFVTDGTLNRSTGWVATVTDAETFVIGTDDVIWYQFSGAGTYTAGESLTLTGTEFSISDGDIENVKLANPSINIAGEAGANTVIALGETLIIEGTNGVDTTISNGKVSIAVNVLDGGTF